MESVKRKIYRKNGLRLLFRYMDDFANCVDAITLNQRIRIEKAGTNRWTPDCNEYPYFIAIGRLEDEDYLYLDKLFKSLNLTENAIRH